MNATTNKAAVGDRMILVERDGARPIIAKVDHVTPSGRIKFAADVATVTFKPRNYSNGYDAVDAKYTSWKYGQAFAYSDEQMAALNAAAEKDEARKAERKAAEEKRTTDDAIRRAEEHTELRNAIAPDAAAWSTPSLLLKLVTSREVLPDGSRLYRLNMPIKPVYAERKGGFEVLILRCKDVQEADWSSDERKTITMSECHMTYINSATYSFASCSGNRYADDEAAIWEEARRQYHSC